MKSFQQQTPVDTTSQESISGSVKTPSTTEHGEGSNEGVDSMADAASSPQSTLHLHKQHRLSLLLQKLAVHINNNNNYHESQWLMFETVEPPKESEDVPLDLSVKSKRRYSSLETELEPFICGACGEKFTLHDRLAKHVASRHRNRIPDSARAYECSICQRRFARSDMLTRHARRHSGIKPYSCSTCGQQFTRSDHLATHQRTHTGVKPYHCSACPYSACRRDMINRHMKIHMRRTKQEPKSHKNARESNSSA